MFLRCGRRLLLRALSQDEKANFQMPTTMEIVEFKNAIHAKYSLLQNVYCVDDGHKLYLEHSGDAVLQNMICKGWTHDHFVGNIFVFAPNGTIIA